MWIDPDDVAAGHQTRMRWRDETRWVRPTAPTHEALVSGELASLVAGRIATRIPGCPKARISPHPYALRGILVCARCGRKLQGSFRPSRSGAPGRVLYRCEVKRSRALPPELADHPPTLYVNEAAIIARLDPWIESFADGSWLTESRLANSAVAAGRAGMLAELRDLDRKIANLISAVESGHDAGVLMDQLARRNVEREAVKVRLAAAVGASALTREQVDALLRALGGIGQVLRDATPQERADAYAALGVQMVCDDRTQKVHVTADLARVGGDLNGYSPPPGGFIVGPELWLPAA